jgi:hypothetical protein
MPDERTYVPASELLPGIELLSLPDNYTPLSTIVILKTLDDEGDIAWFTRQAKDLHNIEALGALTAARNLMSHDVMGMYMPDNEGDEG